MHTARVFAARRHLDLRHRVAELGDSMMLLMLQLFARLLLLYIANSFVQRPLLRHDRLGRRVVQRRKILENYKKKKKTEKTEKKKKNIFFVIVK